MTPEARAIAEQVLKGTKVWLRAPKWYGAVTAGMLPHQLRKAFRLPYGQAEQPIAEAAIARIRRVYPALPERLRYVGPYQEAVARLSGRRRSELLTQWANQLWIGREAWNDVCNQHVLIRSSLLDRLNAIDLRGKDEPSLSPTTRKRCLRCRIGLPS